ncbi:MAG: SUMF1/EgtB/PvdO family nonheme iron enzyme [Pikeienuella sp.]
MPWLVILATLVCWTATDALAERRALVIGIDAYLEVTDLEKAHNDARSVAAALRATGFAVSESYDPDFRTMSRDIARFVSSLEPGDEATLFFAGHGIEVNGENYLLPSDVPNDADPGFVTSVSVALSDVLDRMRATGARLTLAVIDACRNNPFEGADGTRSFGRARGLGRITAPEGTFVIFSAGAGQFALDRLGPDDPHPNSVFTRHLIPLIGEPGLELRALTRTLRQEVRATAKTVQHDQTLAYYDELIGDFSFVGGPAPAQPRRADRIITDYQMARSVGTRTAWEAFMALYGDLEDDFYVQLARAEIEKLERLGIAMPTAPLLDPVTPGRPPPARPSFTDCPDCPEMVVIPRGRFTMGSPPGEQGRQETEGPQRQVAIAEFAIGRTEVTFDDWQACVDGGGCRSTPRPDDYGWGRGTRPVINVSWHDAQEYITWLNSQVPGTPYRLPSEAEWEYAARAGTDTPYPWGQLADRSRANYGAELCCAGEAQGADRWAQIAPVGSFPANAFGLSDMHGNVWEWVGDCWHSSYGGAPTDGTARQSTGSGDCASGVFRGGSWYSRPTDLRSANRFRFLRDRQNSSGGFRVARSRP